MPTRFLSDAEIERLESFPDAIGARDLARYFVVDGEGRCLKRVCECWSKVRPGK